MRSSLPARLLPAALAVVGLGVALGACGTASANGPGTASTTGGGGGSSSSVASSTTTSTPPTTTTNPDLLPQPSAAHPLTILEIGDSLGEDLGFGLGDLYAHDPWVHVVQDAVGDTGLANTSYYNWQAKLESELQQYHPGAVVVFMGANDGQNFWYNGQLAVPGNAVWHVGYSTRVSALMSEATAAGARGMWVGMPIMQDPGFWQEMQTMNAVYAAEAKTHPGVSYYASWPVFANAAGQYVESLDGVVLRDPDGIHIANGGDARLADALVAPMQHTWGITLFPPGTAPAGA
jgi:hypothetical protein